MAQVKWSATIVWTAGATSTGFVYSGGNFTFFSYPGADATDPFGINDSGLISGTAYFDGNIVAVGFLYDGTTFKAIRAPGKSETLQHGINNAGTTVGGYGFLSNKQGFEWVAGHFINVMPP